MKASYNWLKEFVDFSLNPDELADTLSMSGLEVEAMEEYDDDVIFDIGVTPNRPDWLSIRGIAREISAILGIPMKDVHAAVEKEEGEGPVVEIESPDLCPRYSARVLRGVKPGPSPDWLAKRLESCGIRSTSNIVDITNYILLEVGQPMHAFDLDKLAGGKIVVRQAGDTKTFTTLDDEERSLSGDMLLICDAEKPVAIAGVMGGQNTEVSESTVNVLLESAYFKPSSVRRTSRVINLSSESSYRFERGIDIEAVTFALDRAAQLVSEVAGGTISRAADQYPGPFVPGEISVQCSKVSAVIGVDIEQSFIEKTLNGLGCNISVSGDLISVVPPSYRRDIERDIDIIEEVARLYGYENIPSTLPEMQMSAAPEHRTQELIKTLKDSMVKSGYSEAINFSFMSPEELDKLMLPEGDRRRSLIYIRNPLRKEDAVMRTSLVPALLDNVSLNLNRGEKMIRLFEISKVFMPSGSDLPDEIIQMTAIYHKDTGTSIWRDKHDGFYDVKGSLENILTELKIGDYSLKQDGAALEPYLHPGKSCEIIINGSSAGMLGTVHPGVAEAFDIKGSLHILEIFDVEKIQHAVSRGTTFVPLPKYPYVERDIALVVGDEVSVSTVRDEILGVKADIIEAVNVFDIYKGKPVPEDKKSLAFSIRYRSPDRTLTDSEVDELHTSIRKRLEKNLNAELRS